jgi:hypothetical protein
MAAVSDVCQLPTPACALRANVYDDTSGPVVPGLAIVSLQGLVSFDSSFITILTVNLRYAHTARNFDASRMRIALELPSW